MVRVKIWLSVLPGNLSFPTSHRPPKCHSHGQVVRLTRAFGYPSSCMVCGTMVTDTPTGSITGQQDWEWNQRRSEPRSDVAGGPTGRSGRRSSGGARTDRESIQALQRENQRLESEVTRLERKLACVVDQYERRLAEKNRKLADRADRRSDRDESSPLAGLLQWVAARSPGTHRPPPPRQITVLPLRRALSQPSLIARSLASSPRSHPTPPSKTG